MAASKHRPGRRQLVWLYSAITAMYLATFTMFTQVASPPPVATSSPIVVTHVPTPKPALSPRPAIQGMPTHISVPSLGIDLNVQTGYYDDASDTWSLDLINAYYAAYSLPINDSNGTTLIYSHAQAGLFDRLPQIQADTEAIVTTDTGYTFRYSFTSMREVDPSDTSVFVFDGPPTLVLQTCVGDWSQYRALFSFKLLSVTKS